MVVAQLLEQSLQTPKVRGSNPVILFMFSILTVLKRKNEEKEAGHGPFKKTFIDLKKIICKQL